MEEMTKVSKKFSWFVLLSLVVDVIGVIFGIMAAFEFDKITNGNELPKYMMLGATITIGIVLSISTVTAFVAMRGGNVKSAILSLGKHTKIQLLAPLTCLVLGIIGIFQPKDGAKTNLGLLMFLIVSYVVVLFASGFNARGLRGYRKDKETYSYISSTSFVVVGALVVFSILAAISMTKIPSQANSNHIGYLEAFAMLFTVGDIIAFLSLGIMAQIVKKYAPKVTMADADASKLDGIGRSVDKLSEKIDSTPSSSNRDTVAEIRKYKELYDEGILTKEEFEKKKKELLG